MAVTTRSRTPLEPAPATELADRVRVLEEVVRVQGKLLTGLIAHVSGMHSRTPATGRQIIVQEMRLGTYADVDLLERFHSGG